MRYFRLKLLIFPKKTLAVILIMNFVDDNFYDTTAVNFINIQRTNFSYEYDVLAAFPNYMYVEKAAETTFVQKRRVYNVDEIDTCPLQ